MTRIEPVAGLSMLLHSDIKRAHLLHDPSTGALTGLLDWGDASFGHAGFDLAIIGAFCGPHTLQGLLDRLADADAERASASIPFLLTVRWLQDALYEISRGGEPSLRRLRDAGVVPIAGSRVLVRLVLEPARGRPGLADRLQRPDGHLAGRRRPCPRSEAAHPVSRSD